MSLSLSLDEGPGGASFCAVVRLHVWLALSTANVYHVVEINRLLPGPLEAHHWPDR